MIILVTTVMIKFPQAKFAGKQADKEVAKQMDKVRQLTDKGEKAVINAEVKK